MSEAVFPVFGAAFVMVVVLPLCALLARLAVGGLEARSGGSLHGLNARFLVLVGSSMVPVAWLLSAGLHQAESGRSIVACLLDHDLAEACLEPGFFALVLGLILVGCGLRPLSRRSRCTPSTSARAAAVRHRIDCLLRREPTLGGLKARVWITEEPGFAIAAEGLLNPSIVVGAAFAERLSDASLVAAIRHEAEHVTSRDPLRYLVLELTLAANPFGSWLLKAPVSRWLRAREVHCDREAVLEGAAPLPLAEAILFAARPRSFDAAGLGPHDAAVLRFRVELLCAFAEAPPNRCCKGPVPVFTSIFALLAVALMLPHQAGTAALDVLHIGAEYAAALLWR